ncbi:acyltransferase family protein [Streptomyces sp. NPDC101152]|uniref:acyltransferase family protein n=1 Tax=Streptomyces sp. NPDC101152 TaxID=3366116 RepID=UPI003812F8CD
MPVKSFRTLHGIRGVAALCIVILHSPRLFGPAPVFLALAVDLFFALSGFVLAHAYEDRLRRGMTPLAFLRQRWARLYPLYAVGFLLGVVHAVLCITYNSPTEHWSWRELYIALPFAAFMLPVPAVQGLFPLNGPMWSIFFELLANLLWVAFWRPLQSVRILFGTVLVCGGLYVCALMYVEAPALGLTWTTFPGGLARVCYSFGAGLLVHRLRPRLRTPRVPPLMLMGVLPVMALFRPGPIVQLLSVLLVFPLVVLLGAGSEPRAATQGIYASLGKASYCVYVLHRPLAALLYAAALQFAGWRLEAIAPWGGLLFLAGLVAAGLVLTDVFETPARRWLTRRLSGKREEPVRIPVGGGVPRDRVGEDRPAAVQAQASERSM